MTDILNQYLRLWNLSDPELLAQTPTSQVYTAYQNADKVVLKLLTPVGVEDENDGAVALRHFDGHGAVRLRAFVFAYACLSAAWFGDEDDGDVKHQVLAVAQNAERHVDLSA